MAISLESKCHDLKKSYLLEGARVSAVNNRLNPKELTLTLIVYFDLLSKTCQPPCFIQCNVLLVLAGHVSLV